MTDTFRALCAELIKDFDDLRESSEGVAGFHRNGDLAPWDELGESGKYPWLASFDRARDLLAQPEPEGLTDEELLELMPQQFRDDLATVSRAAAHGAGPDITPGIFRVSLNAGALSYARAAIAADRARRLTPQPPADGEVGELVEFLRRHGSAQESAGTHWARPMLRAADLLERLASPACLVINPPPEALASLEAAGHGIIEAMPAERMWPMPVPVSERLPGAEDCDELDNCWQWVPDTNGHHPLGKWELQHRDWLFDPDGDATHWLPANALPLPQGNDN